jgi:hypothetical protein
MFAVFAYVILIGFRVYVSDKKRIWLDESRHQGKLAWKFAWGTARDFFDDIREFFV